MDLTSSSGTPPPATLQDLKLQTRFLSTEETQHVVEHGKYQTWRRDTELGHGAFGVVWREEWVSGPSTGAGKVRAVKRSPRHQQAAWQRELVALFKFSKHPSYFVQCHGWYEDPNWLYIAMEYVPYGTLQTHVGLRSLPEPEAILVISQLAQALKCMHDVGFIHRDLKPLNVLVNRPGPEWHVKIADFGISKDTAIGGSTVGFPGTPSYIAPEILSSSSGRYTAAIDIWALGAIAFCLLTRNPPFESIRDMVRYADGNTRFPTRPLGKVSYDCVQFILETMAPTRETRLTTQQVLAHPWLEVEETTGNVQSLDIQGAQAASNVWEDTFLPADQSDSLTLVSKYKSMTTASKAQKFTPAVASPLRARSTEPSESDAHQEASRVMGSGTGSSTAPTSTVPPTTRAISLPIPKETLSQALQAVKPSQGQQETTPRVMEYSSNSTPPLAVRHVSHNRKLKGSSIESTASERASPESNTKYSDSAPLGNSGTERFAGISQHWDVQKPEVKAETLRLEQAELLQQLRESELSHSSRSRDETILRMPQIPEQEKSDRQGQAVKPAYTSPKTRAQKHPWSGGTLQEYDIMVTIVCAEGLWKRAMFGSSPDPFAIVTIDAEQSWSTLVIEKTTNPCWNETRVMRVTRKSIITVEVFDYRKYNKGGRGEGSMGFTIINNVNAWIDLEAGKSVEIKRQLIFATTIDATVKLLLKPVTTPTVAGSKIAPDADHKVEPTNLDNETLLPRFTEGQISARTRHIVNACISRQHRAQQ